MSTDPAPAPGAAAASDIPPTLRDGYEVHRAALAHRLDVLLLPRQVMTVSHPSGGPGLSFVHGIPESSTLAAVTYAQDKRMRRDLLARAGLPVPPGATFAIGRQLEEAKQFVANIGYPVVVKPAVGDNLIEVFPGLRDEAQFDAAIKYLRTPEAERPAAIHAAYALTLLLEPEEEDGRLLSPANYQFLVEKHVSGELVRFLVLDRQMISAVHCPDGSAAKPTRPNRDVTAEVDPSLAEVAVRAVRAVPGLALAAVDVVLADHHKPASEQDYWIVDLSERPWLDTQARVSESLSQQIGDAILAYQATESTIALDDPAEQVAVEFRMEGATDPAGAVTAVAAAAERWRLAGDVDVTDQVEGTAAGNLAGDAARIAWIFEALLDGRLDGNRAMLIDARHRR